MNYDVSFTMHEYEGKRIYSWFVFNADGETLKCGFESKNAALAWAMRELGFRS